MERDIKPTYDELESYVENLQKQLATLQAQLADRDAMILQMGEQAAVLAKENMAVKAQLREVEGERDHAEKMEAVQKEVADNQTWHVRQLRQLVDEADELYTHFGLIANPGYTGPVNIFEWIGKVRATLAAPSPTEERHE